MDSLSIHTAITTSSDSEMCDRTGFEPELGGELRQNAVFVDETVCIGCGHCAHTASSTFFLEEDYGRARVIAQDGDEEDLVQEAIDTCPGSLSTDTELEGAYPPMLVDQDRL